MLTCTANVQFLTHQLACCAISAEEISGNLDRMGIPYRPEQIDKLVRDVEKKRLIAGVQDGPAEFYNDKASGMLTFSQQGQ